MHIAEKSYQKTLLLLILPALLYALFISLLHIIIFSGFSTAPMDLDFWKRILLALPIHFLPAVPASWLYSRKGLSWRIPGVLLYLLLIVFNVAGFYVESATGKYLHLSEYSYLGEMEHIWPSIRDSGMFLWGALEILICFCIFLWACRALLVRIERGTFSRPVMIWPAIGFLVACVLLGGMVLAAPHVFKMGLKGDDITPLAALLKDLEEPREQPVEKGAVTRAEVEALRRFLGNPEPLNRFSPQNPLCTGSVGKGPPGSGNGRSVILLILESIGKRQFETKINGLPVMPHLHKVARENLYFDNFFPAGEGSIQSMFPLFTGMIPQTTVKYSQLDVIPNMEGFPGVLTEHGYRTAYLHGGDLGFEKQRVILKKVGFQEIIEYDPNSKTEKYGWGYSDGEMLRQLRDWIETHRRNERGMPYFTVLYTLGTHHPYILPPGWEKGAENPLVRNKIIDTDSRLSEGNKKFLKSMVYLDESLWAFYTWYVLQEMPRGTSLFIVSDHPMQAGGFFSRYGFQIPLIIAGADQTKRGMKSSYGSRLAGHLDLPGTMARMVGIAPPPCDQGVNILADPEKWPSDRMIYSVSKGLDKVYVWGSQGSWVIDRKRGRVLLLPDSRSNRPVQYSPDRPDAREISFSKLLLKINYRLAGLMQSSMATKSVKEAPVSPMSRPTPIVVSHRGNTQGAPDDRVGNDMHSIERAVNAGFQWIEVDVNITRDLIPVVIHDTVVLDDQGKEVPINQITLEELRLLSGNARIATLEEVLETFGNRARFLVELKPQFKYFIDSQLIHETARLLKRMNMDDRIIVDSFSRYIAASMKQYSGCEVAHDAPFSKKVTTEWLLGVQQMGLDWVYLAEHQVSEEIIQAAHGMGLKVMVYTVNSEEAFRRIAEWRPDGIMTDYRRILDVARTMDWR